MKKHKILILSHFYYPDIVATAIILQDLAEGLTNDFDVTVLAINTLDYPESETINSVKVRRLKTFKINKESKFNRIFNILVYFIKTVLFIIKNDKFDAVFAVSQPPVLGGFLGRIAKRIKKSKFIYCIQDVNPEQIIAIEYLKNKFLINRLVAMDKKNCLTADRVITIDKDMKDTVNRRFKRNLDNFDIISNWTDDEKIYPLNKDNSYIKEYLNKYNLNSKYIIMYSGNLGLYYDLLNILKVIAEFKEVEDVAFVFAGAGALLNKMKKYKDDNNLNNVCFVSYSSKEELIYSLNAADIHFCISAKGIKGISCPSKFYGIAAVNKPIICVMDKDSELRNIIENNNLGYTSDPEDYVMLKTNLEKIISEKPDFKETRKYIKGGKKNSIDKYIMLFKEILN